MGNCTRKVKNDHVSLETPDQSNQTREAPDQPNRTKESYGQPDLTKIVRITDLKVDRSQRHSLPIPRLQSLLASATIFSFKGLRKDVIVVLIVLSRSSRAYIITQEGLPGFLPT